MCDFIFMKIGNSRKGTLSPGLVLLCVPTFRKGLCSFFALSFVVFGRGSCCPLRYNDTTVFDIHVRLFRYFSYNFLFVWNVLCQDVCPTALIDFKISVDKCNLFY